jgi:beta-mannosidase
MHSNLQMMTLDCGKELAAHGTGNLLVWLELLVADMVISRNLVTFGRPKQLQLKSPDIRTTVRTGKAGTFRITLKATRPAFWCWLELDGADARWSDNFVHLQPGEPLELIATPAPWLELSDFRNRLRVRSLTDTATGD